MATHDLNADQLKWWEVKADIAFIFSFNWNTTNQLREAITMFLSARLNHLACQASKMLAESGSHSTKMLLAANPNSPCELLDYLTEVADINVVIRVAENVSTSPLTLEKLSNHESSSVRRAVAENTNTPEACLMKLAHDDDADVRYCMAEDPNLPASVLYVLTQDENPYVSLRTRKTLSRLLSNAIIISHQQVEGSSSMEIQTQRYEGLFAHAVIAEIQAMYDLQEMTGCPCQTTS